MNKIFREMNRSLNWLSYAQKNNLKLKDFKIEEKERYINKEKEFEFTQYYDITFYIYHKKRIISIVNQKIDLELFDLSDSQLVLESIYNRLEKFKDLSYSQNLIMSYLNEEESILFDENIGDYILLLKKQTYHKGRTIFYEEEISRIDSYLFKEVVF